MLRRRLALAGVGLLAALVLGAGLYAVRGGPAEDDGALMPVGADGIAGSAGSAFAADVALPVEGAKVVRGTLIIGVSAAGQAEAWRRALVTALVGGQVASVAVRESDAIAAGRTLVEVDPAEFRFAVADAEARQGDAEAKYREMLLFDERLTDEALRAERARVARARSGLDAAEVALERARFELQRTRAAAPFAGRVASLRAVPGQWVRPGDELLTVLDLDPIRVEVQVLEAEIGYLRPGRRAAVGFAAFPGETFRGRIETINPLVESGTRTARVTVVVPNTAGRILPGMYARVSLEAREFPDRVLVPRAAILERDRRTLLFVYEGDEQGGRASWRYVTTGLANDTHVEVVPSDETGMVDPGETVLVGGHHTLIHDARVRLVLRADAGR